MMIKTILTSSGLAISKRSSSSNTVCMIRCMSSVTSEGRFFPKTTAESLLRNSSSISSEQVNEHPAYNKIAFLGVGKMAQAILSPVISTGLQPAEQVTIFDKSDATVEEVLAANPKVQAASSIPELVADADLLICAVKPQNINAAFLKEIHDSPHRPSHGTFLSVIAGVPLEEYRPTGYEKIVRAMPNTPAMIGRGMTVWCCTPNLSASERDRTHKVLECLGESMYVDDEKHVDMSTSISGSGPAYIFSLMEDMIDAGVHMGFPRDKATILVYHTILGSTLFAMESGQHPAILRNNVTSPNGTTASAIYELENGGFRTAVKDAMWACYRRSLEMGGHESNVGPGRAMTVVDEEKVFEQLFDPDNESEYQFKLERTHNGHITKCQW